MGYWRETIKRLWYLSAKVQLLNELLERTGIEGTEHGVRELYYNAFNPIINEGFFADKVVLVEGPSEQYSIPIYGEALGINFDKENISIVHSDGKGNIDRLFRIFNGFKIPSYIIFDGDKNNSDTNVKRKTKEILEIMGNPIDDINTLTTTIADQYTVFEDNFDITLRSEIDNYIELIDEAVELIGPCGKPLKHRYIANYFKSRVEKGENSREIIPDSIINIIDKIHTL